MLGCPDCGSLITGRHELYCKRYSACPDCGSTQPYQHKPGCKLAVMENKRNLHTRYKDEFLRTWQGCSHLDCLPECDTGYCQRLADALRRWEDGI